jgi:hypothetical protein
MIKSKTILNKITEKLALNLNFLNLMSRQIIKINI